MPKTFSEVEEVVKEQVGKLGGVKQEIEGKIQEINEQLNKVIGEMHKDGGEKAGKKKIKKK